MERSIYLQSVCCIVMLLGASPNVDAQVNDTIHDVYVIGQAVSPPSASATPPPNCVSYTIGSTGAGTNYGALILQSTDNTNPARILAIENTQNCFGMTSDSVRDQLYLANTNVIPTASGVNTNLTIEYRANFGPSPDGSVIFGGSMTGKFMKKDSTGTYKAVTCNGSTPPNGPCSVTFATAVYSQFDNQEHALNSINSTNPFGGSFNVTIPPGTAVQMGTGLGRTFHARVTVVLPSTDHMVQLMGGALVEHATVEPDRPFKEPTPRKHSQQRKP